MISSTDHPFPDEKWLAGGGHHAFDPFVSLAFMAAHTRRIRLLTMLVVAGYRHPYITAKAAASLDNLSGGRLVLGVGAGYQQPEFAVLGAPFGDRGPRLDAAVAAIRVAWSGNVVDFDDPYFPAHGHVMLPRPAQPDGPPIWFGGNSARARGWRSCRNGLAFAGVPACDAIQLRVNIRVRNASARRGVSRAQAHHPLSPAHYDAHTPLTSSQT